jgi:hypothetical protein
MRCPAGAASGEREGVRGVEKKTTEEIVAEAGKEIEHLLGVILGERESEEDGDLEAIEMLVRNSVHKIGSVLLEKFLNANVYRIEKRAMECRCSGTGKFVDVREKELLTVVGKIHLKRAYYYDKDCGHGWCPKDKELGVEEGLFSPGVQRMMGRVGSSRPYAQAEEDLRELAGLDVNAKAIERVCRELGKEAEGAIGELPWSGAKEAETIYISMDGTGVPVVKSETEGRKGKGLDGRAKTREAKLGCVFTQTGLDEDGHPKRDENSTTYIGRIESAEEFGKSIYLEAERRGVHGSKTVCVIGDGAPWIWNIAQEYFWNAVQIVDLYHAREHYWSCARVIFGDKSRRLWRWTEKRKEELDRGDVEAVIKALKRLHPKTDEARRACEAAVGYYKQNKERMRYNAFRSRGLFVGSGVIEAGCRSVIGQRLKQSGMHWSVKGANSIIALRCILMSHQWDDFWAYRAAA